MRNEVVLARQAAFVFDLSSAREELGAGLGRPPAVFELAERLRGSYSVRPSEIFEREKEGMRAIEQLYAQNHRMVSMIVRKYVYATTLDESDLLQEGNIGLLTAMRLYNTSRAVRFATFASWHVRGTVLRAIMNAHHTIRLPVRVQQEISAIQKEYKQLCEMEDQAAFGFAPPGAGAGDADGKGPVGSREDRIVTEVAARLGWKKEKVINRLHHYKTAQAISLETPCSGGGDSSTVIGDLLACQRSGGAGGEGWLHGDLEDVLLRDELRSALSAMSRAGCEMTSRNAAILRLHYGLEDGVEYTCAQIADMFKMSVSRVYSVIQQELCMLRRIYGAGQARDVDR